MATTPIAGLRYQASGDAPNGYTLGLNLATDLDAKIIVPVANQAARDAKPPTSGLVVFRQDTGDYEAYFSGAWSRIAGPLRQAKVWRTGGGYSVTTADVYETVDFQASRTSGGFTFNNTDNKVTVGASGYVAVEALGYVNGGSGYVGRMRIRRERTSTADRDIIVSPVIRKVDSNDELVHFGTTVPLQLNDKVFLQVSLGSTAGGPFGTDEGVGIHMSVRHVGPLHGATPY